jgi:hypothetical protein
MGLIHASMNREKKKNLASIKGELLLCRNYTLGPRDQDRSTRFHGIPLDSLHLNLAVQWKGCLDQLAF